MNYSHISKDVVKPIRTRYHRVWDEKVRAITGGLTIYPPTKGQWVSVKMLTDLPGDTMLTAVDCHI